MKTTKEKIAEAIEARATGMLLHTPDYEQCLILAQAALDVVCEELESNDMQNELWNLADDDGYYLLAGKRGIKTYYPKLLLKAAADKLREK